MRIGLGLALLSAALIGPAMGSATAAPSVRPVELAPLTVRGLRFHPAEAVTVRVSVRGGRHLAKSTRVTPSGSFTVRFTSLTLTNCAAYTISARGSRGSVASFTMLLQPCGAAP